MGLRMGTAFESCRVPCAADPRVGGGGMSSLTSPSSHGSDRDVVIEFGFDEWKCVGGFDGTVSGCVDDGKWWWGGGWLSWGGWGG